MVPGEHPPDTTRPLRISVWDRKVPLSGGDEGDSDLYFGQAVTMRDRERGRELRRRCKVRVKSLTVDKDDEWEKYGSVTVFTRVGRHWNSPSRPVTGLVPQSWENLHQG